MGEGGGGGRHRQKHILYVIVCAHWNVLFHRNQKHRSELLSMPSSTAHTDTQILFFVQSSEKLYLCLNLESKFVGTLASNHVFDKG